MGKRISRNLIILLNLLGRLLLFKASMVFDVRRKKKVARNFAIAISSSHPIQFKLWKWRTSSIKFQHSSCKQTKIYDDSFKNILNLTHFLPLLFGLFRFHVSMFETYFIFYFFLGDSFLATLLDPCKQLAFFFFFFYCVLEDGHYFLIGMQSYTKVVTY